MPKTKKARSKMRSKTIKSSPSIQMVYSPDDYNSNDGMLTSVWGPSMWHYLHTMSFNYPVAPTKYGQKKLL